MAIVKLTSGVCEEGQTEVPKQSLEVSTVTESRTVPQDFDPGELGYLVEGTGLMTCRQRMNGMV